VSKPSARSYRSPDQRYGQEALGSLTRAERVVCGRLILRQLDRAPRIHQELRKYGPEGTVRLCSARAFGIYELVLVAVAVALAVSGQELAGLLFVILFLLAGALGMMRLVSAAKAGRRWRSAGPGRSEE
jgi:hypothetical protein